MTENRFFREQREKLFTPEYLKELLKKLKLLPHKLRDVMLFAPALVSRNYDGEFSVAIGDEKDALSVFAHEEVANKNRVNDRTGISAYYIATEGTHALCIDPDHLSRIDVAAIEDLQLPLVQQGYREVFIGGFKDRINNSQISLVGATRQLVLVLRAADVSRFSREQTETAAGLMINSLQTGIPMHLQEVMHLAAKW